MKKLFGFAAVFALAGVVACGGGDNNQAANTDTAAPVATPAGTPAGAATAMAVTGTMHEVKMLGDDKGYRFEPATLTIKAGDGVKWVMISGGPHNVAFDPAAISVDVKPQLVANMSNQATGELSSAMYMNPGENVTVSFAGIKAGTYNYHCTPHLAMNMKGSITVE